MFYKVVPNRLFEFWWVDCEGDEQKFFLQIYGKTIRQVKRLLEEYKKSDENYQVDGWMDFLRNKGVPYMEKYLAADFSLEF